MVRVLQVWLTRFPRVQTKVPPLSHYTSAEGLLGICSSNSIWATCAQYSNDTSEVLYAQSVAKEVLNEFFQGRQLTESAEFVRSFLEKKTGLVEGIEITDAYMASFCEASDLLSQWRGYGKTAGFELRFNSLVKPHTPSATEVPAVGSPAMDGLKLVRVEYNKPAQKEMLVCLLEGTSEVLETLEAQPESKYLHVGVAALAALELMTWLYRVKHPSFAEEKEWRIVAFPKRGGLVNSQPYEHPEKIGFRAGRHSLVPYVELRPTEGKLPLSEIICGPGGHRELTSKAVELLLAATGFVDVEVRNSAVPLVL